MAGEHDTQPLGKIISSEPGLEDTAEEIRNERGKRGTQKVRRERHDQEARKKRQERDRRRKK